MEDDIDLLNLKPDKTVKLNIKNIDFIVTYNPNLYDEKDVAKMIKRAMHDEEDLNRVLTEIDILNYDEIYDQIFG